jgi:hypothetical protein
LLHPETGRGSPRFHTRVPLAATRRSRGTNDPLPPAARALSRNACSNPSKKSPRQQLVELLRLAGQHRCDRCLLAVETRTPGCTRQPHHPSSSASRRCSAVGSVATASCCQSAVALSFHGLCSPPGFWPGACLPTRRVSASARSTRSHRTDLTLPPVRFARHAARIRDRLSPDRAPDEPPTWFRHPVTRATRQRGDVSLRSVCSLDRESNRRSDSIPARDRGPSWGF